MPLTRRTLLAAAALSPLATAGKAAAASPAGDVVGKISVGYQGWFACPGDSAPIGGWWHWSRDRFQPPSPANTTIVSWPDTSDYTHIYPTAYPNLGDGRPANLFSSYDQQTVDTHFGWMRTYGIDTAALQRFNPVGDEGPTRDAMAQKVRTAAEATGRKFYVMYDVSGWTNMQSELKTDWTTKMSAHTASSAYARQNGKPVVCVWGFGFNDDNHAFTAAACLDVITWLKAQGCYVIGGVPTYWREGKNDSRTGYLDVYHAFNMISPWMVGRTGDLDGLDWFYTNVNTPDQADCNTHGIDYQPCVLPGDLSAGHRRHGDFYWRSLYNMVRLGAQGLYVSMFDEFNEGNQIAKTAETSAAVPAGTGIRALDEDGTACSADYYLRLTTDGGRMLKGQIPLSAVRPTQPTVGTPTGDLAGGRTATASSANGPYPASNAVDSSTATYWESSGALPQWFQVDLGAAYPVNRLVLRLPSGWERRTQTISVQDGTTLATLAGAVGLVFDPSASNAVTVTLPGTPVRNLRLAFAANTGWPAAQLAQLQAYAESTPPVTDQARAKSTTASGYVQSYAPGNVVDGDPASYWESTNNAFPQWVQVDLGATVTVGRLVLRIPPSWGARTQTLAITASTNGSTFTTLAAAATRTFDPGSGNAAVISVTPTQTRYVRVTVTANTAWPAAQLSTLEFYPG
ncbi:hypothetical protein BJ973_003913 [Actinoplanes tereljensis]|uniref:Lectin n=1 Tax=Paractinoplanes tereljensis TaxID=571912 RepID=A0A919NWP5_9ACTN|nr:discoidin domain-containing protein [Actinoplanes tereljensis]GIF25635.1 lectin [Actinoplanes tereljensis]